MQLNNNNTHTECILVFSLQNGDAKAQQAYVIRRYIAYFFLLRSIKISYGPIQQMGSGALSPWNKVAGT